MISKKIKSLAKIFEDSQHPLLGPTLQGLYFFRIWNKITDSAFLTKVNYFKHFLMILFIVTEFMYLYFVRQDVKKVIYSVSVLGLSVISMVKLYSLVIWSKNWKSLLLSISEEEMRLKLRGRSSEHRLMNEYIRYTRVITYIYWLIVIVTINLMIMTPFIRYISSLEYREEISSGLEPLPQILFSWFPFNNNKMPGYIFANIVHVYMGYQGAITLAIYDMNSVAVMSYFKGQLTILKEKCENLFDYINSFNDFKSRIIECHRQHNVLTNQYKMFNSLLSPTMFLYVLVCSITICGTVVQFSSVPLGENGMMTLVIIQAGGRTVKEYNRKFQGQATLSQKIWIIQYLGSLIVQLFMFCWHSNEVTIQSVAVDRGISNSNWWNGNMYERRLLLLLAGKLNRPFILSAGPFTSLSVPTFISIIKGAYSMYTVLTQMQEK